MRNSHRQTSAAVLGHWGYHPPPPVHCARAPAQNGPKGPIMGGGPSEGGVHFTKENGHTFFLGQIFPWTPGPKVRLRGGGLESGGQFGVWVESLWIAFLTFLFIHVLILGFFPDAWECFSGGIFLISKKTRYNWIGRQKKLFSRE